MQSNMAHKQKEKEQQLHRQTGDASFLLAMLAFTNPLTRHRKPKATYKYIFQTKHFKS